MKQCSECKDYFEEVFLMYDEINNIYICENCQEYLLDEYNDICSHCQQCGKTCNTNELYNIDSWNKQFIPYERLCLDCLTKWESKNQ